MIRVFLQIFLIFAGLVLPVLHQHIVRNESLSVSDHDGCTDCRPASPLCSGLHRVASQSGLASLRQELRIQMAAQAADFFHVIPIPGAILSAPASRGPPLLS